MVDKLVRVADVLALVKRNAPYIYHMLAPMLMLAPTVDAAGEWMPVSDPPKKSGRYLIYTTKYFIPDHIGDPDHVDGMEISGYHPQFGFLSDNGLHAKYWMPLPEPPEEVNTDGSNRNS